MGSVLPEAVPARQRQINSPFSKQSVQKRRISHRQARMGRRLTGRQYLIEHILEIMLLAVSRRARKHLAKTKKHSLKRMEAVFAALSEPGLKTYLKLNQKISSFLQK